MKINPIPHFKYSAPLKKAQKVSSAVDSSTAKTDLGMYNPKSYVSFGQPYNANNDYTQWPLIYTGDNDDDGMPIAEKRKLEQYRKEMQDKNDYLWALSWDKDKAKKEYEQKAENFINKKTAGVFSYMSKKDKQFWKDYYNTEYQKDLSLYNRIMREEDYYKALLQKGIHTRLRSASEIMQNTKGKLENDIAGYKDFKSQMTGAFVAPVTRELLEDCEQKVFNGILICGPTGCGKTLAAETLANETYCTVDRIYTDTAPMLFSKKVKDKRGEALSRYYKKQKQLDELRNSEEFKNMTQAEKDEALKKIGSPRTVVIIDEFDRYFNPLTCDEDVIVGNTDAVKLMFDDCSKFPKDDDPSAAAVTFICTTNYPDRIPLGEINANKLTPIALLPPEGTDFEAVVRHYLKYANELIKEYQKKDSELKLIDVENMKLDKFAEKFKPNLVDGAISNDAIKYNVIKAAKDYIDNPEFDFNIYLLRTFKYSLRDIRPQKLQRYNEQLEKIGLIYHKEEKTTLDNESTLEQIQQRIAELEAYGPFELLESETEELENLYELRKKFTNEGV